MRDKLCSATVQAGTRRKFEGTSLWTALLGGAILGSSVLFLISRPGFASTVPQEDYVRAVLEGGHKSPRAKKRLALLQKQEALRRAQLVNQMEALRVELVQKLALGHEIDRELLASRSEFRRSVQELLLHARQTHNGSGFFAFAHQHRERSLRHAALAALARRWKRAVGLIQVQSDELHQEQDQLRVELERSDSLLLELSLQNQEMATKLEAQFAELQTRAAQPSAAQSIPSQPGTAPSKSAQPRESWRQAAFLDLETSSGERTAFRPSFLWPIQGELRQAFGISIDAVSRQRIFHRGVRIHAASHSEAVLSPSAGKVVFTSPLEGLGDVVIVDHGKNWMSVLGGLAITGVQVGESVEQGQALGTVSEGGLYYELRAKNTAVNPVSWMKNSLSSRKLN